MFDCAMADRKFYLPKDGSMKLQFFHVKDLCRFMDVILEMKPAQHIFNVGNETAVSITLIHMENDINEEKENNNYSNSNYFSHRNCCRFVCKSQGIYGQKGFNGKRTRSIHYGDISYRTF